MDSNTNTTKPDFTPNFLFLAGGSLIYALWYTFCLYRNGSGITYPLFIGGTCLFFCLFLKKCGRTLRPLAIFDLVSLMLLGISTCCTDAGYILTLNKCLILILFLHLFLHSFYEDRAWDIFTYSSAMCKTLFTGIAFVTRPFSDLAAYLKNRQTSSETHHHKVWSILLGILIAAACLPVILLLLASADAVFAEFFRKLFHGFTEQSFFEHLFPVTCLYLFAFFAAYCLICRLRTPNITHTVASARTHEPLTAITFTGIFSAVYVLFCIIQIVYLFAGLGTLPEGYTYAGYAREGFFQLVFVCLINLFTVQLCLRLFRTHRILQMLLSVISLCTFVMIASSTYRMLLYISTYHLTELRVFVLWALIVISVLMLGTIVMIFRPEFSFVKYALVTVTSLYLVYSFAHPDYWIARYNLSSENVQHSDITYLTHLSTDAAPILLEWYESAEEPTDVPDIYSYQSYFKKLDRKSGELTLRKWNYSRYRAGKLLQEVNSVNMS